MSRARFGMDSGCESYTTQISTSTDAEKNRETKEKTRKRRGSCGPTSKDDCGLCIQDVRTFIFRSSTTKKGHPINLMHQCRAICESTGLRCRRHVWEKDTPGWRNEYQQPLWCEQHAHMCAHPQTGHKNWYKNVCDKDGLKQPDLQFMNNWIEAQTPPGVPRRPYHYILNATTSKRKATRVAEQIETAFWRKVYKKSSHAAAPSASDMADAYKDPTYLYLITKYFVFLEECANRRHRNNNICFSGEYDTQHDNYVRTIDVMIGIMKDHLPNVKSNLSAVRASLLSDTEDQYTLYLRQQEPRVTRIQDSEHTIIFNSNDWPGDVIITYRTVNDLKKLNGVAPQLYQYLYEYSRLEYLENNIEIPPIATDNTIVTPSKKKKFISTDAKEFEKSIRHILSTSSIRDKDRRLPSVWSLLTFMDFWNIGVVDSDAGEIMRHMIHTFPISTTMEMLSLAQGQGNNFFLRKQARSIIREILNAKMDDMIENCTNRILEIYTNRIQKSKVSEELQDVTKNSERFKKRVDRIDQYLSRIDIIPNEIFKLVEMLNDDPGNNERVISKIHTVALKTLKHKPRYLLKT